MTPGQYIRHESELGAWEVELRQPHVLLAPYVERYAVYREHIAGFSRRREVPSAIVPLLISLGPAICVGAPADPGRTPRPYDAFVAGPHDSFALTESGGEQAGIQVNFTLVGARMFLGLPLQELANRAFPVDEVLGAEGRILVERLRAAPSWDACFVALERAILERLARATPVPEDIAWTTAELSRPDRLPIATMASMVGYSHKQLVVRFRREIGLPPGTLARVFRFERALALLEQRPRARWTDIAAECGYYDQAHLSRDFRAFTGYAPGEYRRRMVADNGGVIDF